jgi:AcrR family transcriptional regulator
MAGQRKSAEQRREEIVAHALRHFAQGGYHGTSTESIARDAGISQPYLFRLFKTKRELFLTCNDVSNARIIATFEAAVADAEPGGELEAMGAAYVQLLDDRDRLLFQMQSYAACSDPVIQERVRAGYGDIVREVTRLSKEPPEKVWQFFATGMLLNVIASLDLPAIAEQDTWAAAWCEPGELIRSAR